MNKREMKRALKEHLAGLIYVDHVEDWASLILNVDKTEATKSRWRDVQMELFKQLFGGE